MRHPLVTTVAALLTASVLLAACGSTSRGDAASPADDDPGSATAEGFAGRITVFAAASLTEAFTSLGREFEQANPSATITFNFGPSSSLATQITEGAPADVFASASARNMATVVDAGAGDPPTTFAQNTMAIAVPSDNPANITALADLANPAVKVALCQEDVPCGVVAAKVFANAGIVVTPVTLEADVRATLTKVQLGEVDAGVVYVTDILAAGDKVTGIAIPAGVNAATSYPIATISTSKTPDLAQGFVDYVLSDDGAAVLTAAGFGKP